VRRPNEDNFVGGQLSHCMTFSIHTDHMGQYRRVSNG
jgi:hypothetical protein